MSLRTTRRLSDILEQGQLFPRRSVQEVGPKDIMAYSLVVGFGLFLALFILFVYASWFFKTGGGGETIDTYMSWISLVGKDLLLPILTLLLGYLFGVKGRIS